MSVFTIVVLLLSYTFSLAQTKPTTKPRQQSPRLHVIFALEPRGVEYGRVNMENDTLMRRFVETVQRGLGYPMKIRWMDPNHFTAKALKDTISALKTTPNDIVIVYYSGYGIPPAQSSEQFANWRLDDVADKGLPIGRVEGWLKGKNIHVGLLIADCSTILIDKTPGPRGILPTVDLTSAIMKQLFLRNKGIVRLGSSMPSAPGYINRFIYDNKLNPGTVFTNGLYRGLEFLLEYTDPDSLPGISFECLRLQTENQMSVTLNSSGFQQVPILEVKNWNGTVIRTAQSLVKPVKRSGRWQGLAVDEKGYEALNSKSKDTPVKKLPITVDLSKYAPPVLDQGNKGNCVAIAIGYYMYSILQAVRRNSTSEAKILEQSCSPFYLYNAVKQWNDENCTYGIDPAKALEYLKAAGAPRFSDYPDYCGKSVDRPGKYFRIQDYVKLFSITSPKNDKVVAVKQALAERSPVVAGIQTTGSLQELSFSKTWIPRVSVSIQNLKEKYVCVLGIAKSRGQSRLNLAWDPYKSEALAYGHALCVVGYDDTMLGKGAFKLVNSWGKSWGNSGYFWMSYEDFGKFAKYGYQAYLNKDETGPEQDTDVTLFTGASSSTKPPFTLMRSYKGLTVYDLNEPQRTGTRLTFRVDVRKQAYVYLVTANESDSTAILEFPRQDKQTIVTPGKSMYYPGVGRPVKLDTTTGTEYFLFLFSDRKINTLSGYIQAINTEKGPFPERVKRALHDLLIPDKQIQYKPKKMGFFLSKSTQPGGSMVPLLVRMNHVR